ncbi:choline transporter [Dictyobacter alpinus]|uniref:Choline transporter n=1 Tax=Dictyobacter alpinus TaxID=2014873 RepID=A0A402BH05_9CHLR|nr:phosphate ABC transporter ATP-binding protein [Dictyobacter alpinus]GCE30609.1 choline transporter [Dictyobacter alpinus]
MNTATSLDQEKIVLEAKNLRRVVDGDKAIVNDISLAVHKGETLAIVGPSGSGKSSFLRLLNRLDEPTSGTVLLDGVDYTTMSPRVLRRKVGMVMQSAYLFPGTVTDNITFGPRSRGEQVSETRVKELLEHVQLAGYEKRDINGLSGGEAHRVSLARTLINDPHVLLLDEPTSALDEDARASVEQLINTIMHSQDLTNIIITHDMAQAARLADRVAVIKSGKIERIGTVKEVLHDTIA